MNDRNDNRFRVALLAGLVVLAAGCASEKAKESTAVPTDVADALLPPVGFGATARKAEGGVQRFDVNVHEASAPTFFMSLVEGTSYNMTVQPGVTGSITLNLKNVTVP